MGLGGHQEGLSPAKRLDWGGKTHTGGAASREKFGAGREKLWTGFIPCDRDLQGDTQGIKVSKLYIRSLKHRGKQRNSGSRFLMREELLGALQQWVHRGSWAGDTGSQAGSCGAGDPLHAQLLGGEGV